MFNATTEGKALLRCRWHVEPTIAWLVRYNAGRRARRVGRAAAQCQVFQACAVFNLQVWLGRRDHYLVPHAVNLAYRPPEVRQAA